MTKHPTHAFQILKAIGAENWEDSSSALSLADTALQFVMGNTNPGTYHRTKSQLFEDAYLSFDFSMRNLFLEDGPLEEKSQDALQAWLKLLQKTTPPSWKIHNVLDAVLDNFKNATRDEKEMIQILDRFPKKTTEWSPACTKGEDGMGYTCGLWQLFHIMSVGVVEWNKQGTFLDLSLSSVEVADTLKNFIEYFFRCDECRTNFLKAYEACEQNRCQRLIRSKRLSASQEFSQKS